MSLWDNAGRDAIRGATWGALIGLPLLVVALVGVLLLCVGLVALCVVAGVAGGGG